MKLLQIVAIILALSIFTQSKDCQISSQQTFDLLQEKGIQEYTSNGSLYLNSDSDIIWKANLPQPKQNTLLRFKLQVHTRNNLSLFVPKFAENTPKDIEETFFKLYFPPGVQEMDLEFNYGDNYLPLTAYLDEKIFIQPQWIAVYFQKDYVSIFYGKRLQRMVKLDNPEQNYLNMFSLYNSEDKLRYSLYEVVNDGSAKIQDLQIFNDITEEQEDCLLWYDEPEYNLIDQILDFFGLL